MGTKRHHVQTVFLWIFAIFAMVVAARAKADTLIVDVGYAGLGYVSGISSVTDSFDHDKNFALFANYQ